jgi:hypothetical protein
VEIMFNMEEWGGVGRGGWPNIVIVFFVFLYFAFFNIFVTGFPVKFQATLPEESTAVTVSRLPRTLWE